MAALIGLMVDVAVTVAVGTFAFLTAIIAWFAMLILLNDLVKWVKR